MLYGVFSPAVALSGHSAAIPKAPALRCPSRGSAGARWSLCPELGGPLLPLEEQSTPRGALSSRSKCPAGRAPHLAEAGGGGTGGFLSHLQPRVVLQGAGGAGTVVHGGRRLCRAHRALPAELPGHGGSAPAAQPRLTPQPQSSPQPAIAVVPPRGKFNSMAAPGEGVRERGAARSG